MSEWTGPIVELEHWGDFAGALNEAARELGLEGDLLVRNFERTTFELGQDGEMGDEIDRLQIVKRTGTDRDGGSTFWNADGHDHNHDEQPAGKRPADILYAYVATLTGTGYLVRYDGPAIEMDLVEGLSELNAILVYQAARLHRVSKNEHWFMGDPKEALQMVFVLKPDQEI